MAQATGGEITPKSLDKLTKSSVFKSYLPLRQGLIMLAFGLFLLEVAMRKFAFAEPD
jgi:recombinational DNA repair protein (RecF pathway)